MEFELLGNICEVVRGSSPRPQGDKRYYGGNIPRLMIADVTRDKKYVTPIIDSLTEEGAAKSRPMKKGDLIIAVSGDPGRVCFLNVDACIHDGFVGLRNLDESKYDKEFLYYYLTFFKSSMKHRAYGAIFQNITTDILKGIKIPKLSISAQNNIAKLASKAENLIAQRKESIRLLDEFLSSTFLEMFGDPARNEKGWEVKIFEEFTERITKGESPKWQGFDYLDSGVRFITSENVLWGSVDLQKAKFIHEDFHKKLKRSQLKENDLLVNLVGASVGRASLCPKEALPANINQAVATITLNHELINEIYVMHLFINPSFQRLLLGNVVEAARANLSLSDLRNLKFPVPPIELQTQFAKIVEKTEALKTQYQQSLQELENLYGSLSQKAFMGELFINKPVSV